MQPTLGGECDHWRAYFSSWHPVSLGSVAIEPPYLGLLAVFATVFGGKAWLAVDALFLLAVPLATTTAYLASSRWIRSRAVRAWMAVAYGLLPVLTGAVAQGRLGTVAATILAPLAARSAALVFIAKRRRQDSTDPRWPAAFATGLWLAALMALVPMSYPIAVAAIACTGVALVRSLGGLARVLTAVSIPPLLLPWSLALATEPAHWFAEAGRQDPVGAGVAAQGLQLALGRPGGPGAAPAWIGAGILAAAFVALLRRDRRAAALAAWVVGLAGLVVATVQSGAVAELPQFYDGFVAWPGFAVVVVQGAALVAAAAAADGAIAALAGGGFGWRQPTAALVALAAGAAPFLGLTWWVVEGYDGPLRRGAPVALPAYLVEAQVSPTRERTLVIDTADQRPVTYQLVRDDGPRTGDEALAPPLRQSLGLDRIVAKLVSDPNARDVHALADYAVANVVLSAPADRQVASRLDSLAVLTRASAGAEQAAAWRLTASTGRVRLLPTNSVPGAGEVLPSAESTAAATIRPGSRPRRLALAENRDASWRATLNGQVLRRQDSADWGQRFAVGREGGPLRIGYDSGNRRWWLLAQLGMVVVALVLAAPGIRRASSGAQA